MVLEMIKRYIKSIIYSVILLGLLGVPLSVAAQQELTREERIKALERLKMEDEKFEVNTLESTAPKTLTELERLELPPLSVFLDAVIENATVKRAQSQVEQVKNEYRLQKRDWLNYIRLNGNYSYGRYNIIGNASDEFTPMYQTTMSSAQHNFNVGASIGVSLGDIFNRPTKAETAALYNAQMKICEYNFINGTMDITDLSMERSRRSGAVTAYEQARVALHNSIILLEMLTNVKIIKDKL